MQKHDRQLDATDAVSVKHRDKDRDDVWATRRIHQVRRYTCLFVAKDYNERLPILTEDQACEVDDLCQVAAFQAVRTVLSRSLQTGCPALWTIALVQQVWSLHNHGWVTETAEARDRLSFSNMHNVCLLAQGESTSMPEVNTQNSLEMRKTKRQREYGVVRKFPAHSFGSREQIEAKISCLDELLKAAEHMGIGHDIKRMLPPRIYSRPKPLPNSFESKCANALAKHPKFGNKNF